MKIFAFLIALSLLASPAAFAAHRDSGIAPPAGTSATGPAPADEYFGKLEMSVLGIHNELVRLTDEVQSDPAHSARVLNLAALLENSMHDWEHHYPRDPWLARHIFGLEQMYAHIPTREGQLCARRVLNWLTAKYRSTRYGADAEVALSHLQRTAGRR